MAGNELVEAVENFLLAESWEASRAVVSAEPELLGDDAQEVLSGLVERARKVGDEVSAEVLETHRELLERSSAVGVDEAFRAYIAPGAAGGVNLDDILAELAEPPSSGADMPRRIELCHAALSQLSHEQDPELWALLQASLGTSLLMSTVGSRADNVEGSITALEAAAEEFCSRDMPDECARTRNNLGLAFEARERGEPDKSLEQAIEAYEQALAIFREQRAEAERAETLNNLGNAYNRRQAGQRDDNRDRAIELYEEALDLLADERSPAWVRTQVNLGVALIERFRGDRLENLERGIAAFRAALAQIDAVDDGTDWAHVQANLGNALVRRASATGDDEDLELATVAFEAALEAYEDVHAPPLNRALTLSNLGTALLARDDGARAETVERAIACFREALDLLSPTTSPLDWAQAQNNLAKAYRQRVAGEREENIELAIEALAVAAKRLDRRNAPVEYAQVMKNLGGAYRERLRGELDDNLEKALSAYAEALRIRQEIYGPDHARVASVLYSIAKAQRLAGNHAAARASIERALAIDEAAETEPAEHLARGYRRLASTARELGDLAGAERALVRALALDEEAQGPDHPDVFLDLRRLAQLRHEMGKDESAVDTLERAVTIEELSPSGAPGGVRHALMELADLLRTVGDLAGAERTAARAVELDEAVFGSRHPRVGESLITLAGVLNEAHDVSRAQATADRATTIQQATGGRLPPRAAAALATLTRLLDEQQPPTSDLHITQSRRQLPASGSPVRLCFSETLKGYIAFGVEDPFEGWQSGRKRGGRLTLRLAITIDDVNGFLGDPGRTATVTGLVSCAPLSGERHIDRGSYDIQFGSSDTTTRTIAYDLDVAATDGIGFALHGERTIDEVLDTDLLSQASRLIVKVTTADERSAAGLVTVRHLDFLEQLGDIRVDATTPAARVAALDGFARASLGPLWDFHARRALEVANRNSTESVLP